MWMGRWLLLFGALALTGCQTDTFQAADASQSDAGDAAQSDAAPCTGPTYCLMVDAAFCEDFDESLNPSAGWSASGNVAGYSLEVTDAKAVSCPQSVHVVVPDGGANVGLALLEEDFTLGAANLISVDFELLLGAPTPGQDFTLFAVTDGTQAGAPSAAVLYATSDSSVTGWVLHAGTANIAFNMPPSSSWMHVQFNVSFPGTGFHVVLIIDGTQVATADGTLNGAVFSPTVVLGIGLLSDGIPPANPIYYDNVVVHL
jgi:hypothetical protein